MSKEEGNEVVTKKGRANLGENQGDRDYHYYHWVYVFIHCVAEENSRLSSEMNYKITF